MHSSFPFRLLPAEDAGKNPNTDSPFICFSPFLFFVRWQYVGWDTKHAFHSSLPPPGRAGRRPWRPTTSGNSRESNFVGLSSEQSMSERVPFNHKVRVRTPSRKTAIEPIFGNELFVVCCCPLATYHGPLFLPSGVSGPR